MFDKLFSRFKKAEPAAESTNDALALSVAALLVEAARMDQHYEASEIAIIDRALKAKFGLNDADAAALRAKAETEQANATDIQRFTKVAKAMNAEEKIGLIESLWEIILSDGNRDSFEDTLMRRICGLIYVDDQDSGAARARVAARLNLS